MKPPPKGQRGLWSSEMQDAPLNFDDEHARDYALSPPYLHGNLIDRALTEQRQSWLHAEEIRADATADYDEAPMRWHKGEA